jgi:hypothetical protein
MAKSASYGFKSLRNAVKTAPWPSALAVPALLFSPAISLPWADQKIKPAGLLKIQRPKKLKKLPLPIILLVFHQKASTKGLAVQLFPDASVPEYGPIQGGLLPMKLVFWPTRYFASLHHCG